MKSKGPSGISKGIPRGKHLTGRAGQARQAAKLSIHFCGICGLFTPFNVKPI